MIYNEEESQVYMYAKKQKAQFEDTWNLTLKDLKMNNHNTGEKNYMEGVENCNKISNENYNNKFNKVNNTEVQKLNNEILGGIKQNDLSDNRKIESQIVKKNENIPEKTDSQKNRPTINMKNKSKIKETSRRQGVNKKNKESSSSLKNKVDMKQELFQALRILNDKDLAEIWETLAQYNDELDSNEEIQIDIEKIPNEVLIKLHTFTKEKISLYKLESPKNQATPSKEYKIENEKIEKEDYSSFISKSNNKKLKYLSPKAESCDHENIKNNNIIINESSSVQFDSEKKQTKVMKNMNNLNNDWQNISAFNYESYIKDTENKYKLNQKSNENSLEKKNNQLQEDFLGKKRGFENINFNILNTDMDYSYSNKILKKCDLSNNKNLSYMDGAKYINNDVKNNIEKKSKNQKDKNIQINSKNSISSRKSQICQDSGKDFQENEVLDSENENSESGDTSFLTNTDVESD